MTDRYATPEMAALWTEERRLAAWLEVELAASDAMADEGIVPREAARAIRERARPSAARMRELERALGHDLAAFVDAVAETVGPEGRWLHFGLTSSDVLDTALAVLLRDAGALLGAEMTRLRAAVRERALRHRDLPMAGRTHGVHAEPITLGLKFLLFWDELGRAGRRLGDAFEDARVGKLSGAVGTFAHVPPRVEERVCARLGLASARVASQVVPRERHAAIVSAIALAGASLERFATEVRHLQMTEVGEIEEPFGGAQKGSSAMPHKKNPVRCERVAGLARILRGHAVAALENVALWHERDISHSSAERILLPEATSLLHFLLREMTAIVSGLVVHPERMRENLDRSRGLTQSQAVLLALVRAGMERDAAYRAVQEISGRVRAGAGDLATAAREHPEVARRIPPAELSAIVDEAHAFRNVAEIYRRSGIEEPGA